MYAINLLLVGEFVIHYIYCYAEFNSLNNARLNDLVPSTINAIRNSLLTPTSDCPSSVWVLLMDKEKFLRGITLLSGK